LSWPYAKRLARKALELCQPETATEAPRIVQIASSAPEALGAESADDDPTWATLATQKPTMTTRPQIPPAEERTDDEKDVEGKNATS
jgi:hypothetical protein